MRPTLDNLNMQSARAQSLLSTTIRGRRAALSKEIILIVKPYKTQHMKKVIHLLIIATLLFAGCVNRIDDEEDETTKGSAVKLFVETRADGTATLTYPVTVYAFDAEGKCAASQTIASAAEALALNLLPGNYHLAALAGTNGYTLPSPMQRTSLITLTENTPAASALMSGHADITVAKAAVSADIRLSYRVTRLALTLTEIPAEVTAVQVRFSPQYAGYSMQGSFGDAGVVSTVTCTKRAAAGTWGTSEFHIFPGSGQQTVFTILLTHADGTTSSYGYTHTAPLLVATPYLLSGSYKKGLAVNGSLEAEGWKTAVNISFDFGTGSGSGSGNGNESGGGNDSGSGSDSGSDSGSNEAIPVTEIPTMPSIWKGACVIGVSNRTTTTATLLVMSVEEWEGLTPAEATSTASSYQLASLPGAWRLPAQAEITTLRDARKALPLVRDFDALLTHAGGNVSSSQGLYLCTDNNGSYLKYSWGGTTTPEPIGTTASFRVRAVRSVPVAITK